MTARTPEAGRTATAAHQTRAHGRRTSRAENAARTREALFEAALRVVMKSGYGRCSVARITQEAGVSQGTFYSYFPSLQALIAQLLTRENDRFQGEISPSDGDLGFFDTERARFALVLHFARDRPYILRLLAEAEVADPPGFRSFMQQAEQRYLRILSDAQAEGEVRSLAPCQVRIIAEMIIGCRAQIALHIGVVSDAESARRTVHERWSVDGLGTFLAQGLGAVKAPRTSSVKASMPEPATATTRTAIFEAAAREISERGFAETTIQRIVERADVALGTFYAYFEGREEFLVELVRHFRGEVLARAREASDRDAEFVEQEARSMQAFFELLVEKPWLAALPAEAAVWAPQAYRRHFGVMCRAYRRRLNALSRDGDLPAYRTEELIVLGAIFTSARHYLASLFRRTDGETTPDIIVGTYVQMLAHGLADGPYPILVS